MKLIIISIILTLLTLLRLPASYAQMSSDESKLISSLDRHDASFDPRRPKFLKIGGNAITRYNPLSLCLSSSLFIYQKVISPQLQSKCPYEISCSAFSKASIEEFGVIKGIPMSADRLTRCTQFTQIDIVPSQVDDRSGHIKDNPTKYRKPHSVHNH